MDESRPRLRSPGLQPRRPSPDTRHGVGGASVRVPRATARYSRATRIRGLSRLPRARRCVHRRGAVDRQLDRHRPERRRQGDPRRRPGTARAVSRSRPGRSRVPGRHRHGVHPLRGDAQHGAAPRGRGRRARRAQGGGCTISAGRAVRSAGRRWRARSPGGGARAVRRDVGSARRPRARGASRSRRGRLPLGWRNRPRSARDDRARARPGGLRAPVRILATGARERGCADRLRSAARRQSRLSPVRRAPARRRRPRGGPGHAQGQAVRRGMEDSHLRQRRTGHPENGESAELLSQSGRSGDPAGRRGRGRQRGAWLARHSARGHRHPEVHRRLAISHILDLSLPVDRNRVRRRRRRARDRRARASRGGRGAEDAAADTDRRGGSFPRSWQRRRPSGSSPR